MNCELCGRERTLQAGVGPFGAGDNTAVKNVGVVFGKNLVTDGETTDDEPLYVCDSCIIEVLAAGIEVITERIRREASQD